MANWCDNRVAFHGNAKAMEQVNELFKQMAEKQREKHCGQLPDFITDDTGYFFDIDCWEAHIFYYQTRIFYYQTKWTPNIQIVKEIAVRYGLDFILDYEELGCEIYGRATCKDGVMTDVFLEQEDFEKYSYDEQEDTYHFEGKVYESEYDILDTLMERKLNK